MIFINVPFAHGFICMLVIGFLNFQHTQRSISPLCLNDASNSQNNYYMAFIDPFFCWMSVLIYLITLVVFRRRKPSSGLSDLGLKRHFEFQRKLTLTMGLVALCTLVFDAGPRLVTAYVKLFLGGDKAKLKEIEVFGSFFYFISQHLYFIVSCNPLANIFIYMLRVNEIRKGIYCLLKCKKLTDNILSGATPLQERKPHSTKRSKPDTYRRPSNAWTDEHCD